MNAGKWVVGLMAGLMLSSTALAQASFPTQEYLDELNKAMQDEVKRQSTIFDEEGLRLIATNLAADRPELTLLLSVGTMVSDTVSAEQRKVLIEDLRVGHFDLACQFQADYLLEFADINALRLHFVVVTESKELLYDDEQTCTIDDIR